MVFQHDESGTIIGYIWPKRTRCPFCGSPAWLRAGYTRAKQEAATGSIQYRRCDNIDKPECPGRETPYKVIAIGVHVDRGGDQSEIVDL